MINFDDDVLPQLDPGETVCPDCRLAYAARRAECPTCDTYGPPSSRRSPTPPAARPAAGGRWLGADEAAAEQSRRPPNLERDDGFNRWAAAASGAYERLGLLVRLTA